MYGKHGTPLDEWTLASRWRYALVWAAPTVLALTGLNAMFGSIGIAELLFLALAALVITGLVQAFIGYPRAKAKASPRQTASRA